MNFNPPSKIKILSDDNEIQFIKIKKVGKEELFCYRFIKSIEKLNLEVCFTELELNKNLRNTFKVI